MNFYLGNFTTPLKRPIRPRGHVPTTYGLRTHHDPDNGGFVVELGTQQENIKCWVRGLVRFLWLFCVEGTRSSRFIYVHPFVWQVGAHGNSGKE